MRKSLLKLLFTIAALSASVTVHALGMGGINVTSALGRPLQADIEIVAATKSEKNNLEVRLAPTSAYRDAGLAYPHGIKFKFQLDSNSVGLPYLRVTSDQAIDDPFVSLLIEVTWPSGRLLREYTFLLDPPGYVPAQVAVPDVQVVAPVLQSAPVPVVIPDTQPALAPESEPLLAEEPATEEIFMPIESTLGESAPESTEQFDEITDVETLPEERIESVDDNMSAATEPDINEQIPVEHELAEETAPAELEEFEEVTEVIPESDIDPILEPMPEPTVSDVSPVKDVPETLEVKRGDTMFEIAEKYKQSDVSVERMLVALYRANVEKFDDENMNRIKAGKIIRMPDADEVLSVTQADAKNEIRVQAKDWNAYRQKLASASQQSIQPQEEIQQVAVGKINSSVIDQAPVAKKSAKEVLKLSKGEAPGDKAGVGGEKMTAQDKKNAKQEDAIAKSKSSDESKARAALLQKNLKDMERLAQLRAEAAALAAKPSGAPVDQKSKAVEKKVKVESSIQPPEKPAPKPKPAAKPKTQPKPAQVEQGLIDQIMEDPLYLAGGALVLIGLGGLGVVMMRRRKAAAAYDHYEDVGEETGSRLAVPVEPSPETGDFTRTAEADTTSEDTQTQVNQDPDSVDPISEAELFLSFGRDVQAEEILKDALSSSPNNQQIHLKLLGIYSSRQDVGEFETVASQLKEIADEDTWQQAAEMGLKLDPNNALYGGSGTMEETGSATVQMAAADFSDTIVETAASEKPSVLDFDINATESEGDMPTSTEANTLGSSEATVILNSPEDISNQEPSMDFDISSDDTSATKSADAEVMNFEDTIIDVTGGDEPSNAVIDIGDESMEFTLDLPNEKSGEPAPQINTDFSDINLDLDSEPETTEETSEVKGDQWQEVATKLDLAKAYQEMGDADGSREILDEVLREGDAEQKQAAQSLLDQLG